jgi:hypothetical protein
VNRHRGTVAVLMWYLHVFALKKQKHSAELMVFWRRCVSRKTTSSLLSACYRHIREKLRSKNSVSRECGALVRVPLPLFAVVLWFLHVCSGVRNCTWMLRQWVEGSTWILPNDGLHSIAIAWYPCALCQTLFHDCGCSVVPGQLAAKLAHYQYTRE